MTLTGQDAWTPAGGQLTLRFDVTGAADPSELSVVLTLHDLLQSRKAFEDSVDGGSLGPARQPITVPLALLPATGSTRTLTIGLQTAADRDPRKLAARATGVYPLEVQLRDADDRTLSGFVTHAVVAAMTPAGALAAGRPLDLAWVWPLAAEPAYHPDGTPDPAVVAELAPSGRLGTQVAALASAGVPLTVAPDPETADAWSSLAARQAPGLSAGVAALRSLAATDQVLAGSFVPLDLPAVIDADLTGVIDGQLRQGEATLNEFFGTRLDPRTASPGDLDPFSLLLLSQRGVDRIVLDEDELVPVTEDFSAAHPYQIEARPGDPTTAVEVMVGDAALERFLDGPEPPALRAAHLLAGLALVSREQPNLARGVTLVSPRLWAPSGPFLDAVLAGLRGNPLLRPVTVDEFLAEVPAATSDGQPVLRTLAPEQPAATPITLREYQVGAQNQAAVASLVGPDDPRTLRGERALLSAVTALWQTPTGRAKARALVDGIGESVNDFLARIQVPGNSTITITSSKAEIPLTFKNDTGRNVAVHVRFESDKLLFPGGNVRDVVLPPRSTTIRFPVETRSSGTMPVVMTVTTNAGLPIARSEIRVRSTFVSGVGVFLAVGAGLFLALWWGWEIRRRRRARKTESAGGLAPPRPAGQPA